MQRTTVLVFLLGVFSGLFSQEAVCAAAAPGRTIYVASTGNDAWSGTLAAPQGNDGPFLTLERARDEIRHLKKAGGLPQGGIVVEIQGGMYELKSPLKLSAEDSGTAETPITYCAQKNAQVSILGGRVITGWHAVSDPAVLQKLDESARTKVVQADLKALGITDLGKVQPGPTWGQSEAGLELFFQQTPMTLARWPNEGFAKIVKVLGSTPLSGRPTKTCKEGVFTYEGERPRRWLGQPDVMLEGYWCLDWADQRLRVKTIDPEKHAITLEDKPEHTYGFREGQWYYAYNLLSEIDRPGEWYLDRGLGVLYFWPPASIEQGKPMVSVLPSLIAMDGAAHVTLRGLTLEVCRNVAITAHKVANVQVLGCTIRNTGGFAISLSGKDSRVAGCDIYDNGNGGIALSGGERKTLTPGNLVADNNHIHDFGRVNRVYKAGISLQGVGNRITHNLIDNAPHAAILHGGNEHLIEFNEMHSVCYESNDAGAVYSGRNWTMRGTVVRHNYFHDISGHEGRGCVGVYLDDQFSGTEISGNLFVRVTRAAMIGGGRDCTIANNIFVDCKPAVHVDARGLTWPAGGGQRVDLFYTMKKSLEQVPYQNELWSKRYPKLATILEENPMAPLGDVIAQNICVGGKWGSIDKPSMALAVQKDNLIDQDPHFVDAAHGDYRLKADSPAWKIGFARLPLEKMGLYESAERASWPVRHTVRPVGTRTAK